MSAVGAADVSGLTVDEWAGDADRVLVRIVGLVYVALAVDDDGRDWSV